MTKLSVNLNKIALLRNARGHDYPNVLDFARKFINLGVQGITVHPRPDERHITVKDTIDLSHMISRLHNVEFNIEGYPSESFMNLIESTKPTQCTLVPDSPNQLTSDHGWNLSEHGAFVKDICSRLSKSGVRTSIFLNPDIEQVKLAADTGTDRIELYTEEYAASYNTPQNKKIFDKYKEAATKAQKYGLGVNAGHDLNLTNLAKFLTIPGILEVSIGHALTVECIEHGMEYVIKNYINICNARD